MINFQNSQGPIPASRIHSFFCHCTWNFGLPQNEEYWPLYWQTFPPPPQIPINHNVWAHSLQKTNRQLLWLAPGRTYLSQFNSQIFSFVLGRQPFDWWLRAKLQKVQCCHLPFLQRHCGIDSYAAILDHTEIQTTLKVNEWTFLEKYVLLLTVVWRWHVVQSSWWNGSTCVQNCSAKRLDGALEVGQNKTKKISWAAHFTLATRSSL